MMSPESGCRCVDQLTDEQTPQGEIGYGYDAASRRSTMQVVGQPQVSSTVGLAGACPERNRRNNANRRTSLTLPNGVR